MSKRYVIDQNIRPPPMPEWSVSTMQKYGSLSVAWFWLEKDAKEYAAWKNTPKSRRKRYPAFKGKGYFVPKIIAEKEAQLRKRCE